MTRAQEGTAHVMSVELDSAAGFRAFADLSPNGVYVAAEGRIVFANIRGVALLGGTCLADLQHQPALDFVHPSYRRQGEARMAQLIHERRSLAYAEEQLVRLDGTVVQAEVAGSPIELDGEPAAVLVVRDITGRKSAERALVAAEERLHAAFKQAPTPMLITDADGIIIRTNPALGRLLGRTHRAYVGERCFTIVAPPDRAAVQDCWIRLASGGGNVAGEFRYQRADGGFGWVYACAAVMEADHGCVVHLTDITASRLVRKQLANRANRDPLTGLVNRSVILDLLHQAGDDEPGQKAVLYLDLDGFKAVNDQYGHHVGDAVLRIIAGRLRDAVAGDATVGRLGGDEFVVVVRGADSSTRARALAASIKAAVSAPILIADFSLRVGVSIGIADAAGDAIPASHLLARADAAMYRAKTAHPQPRHEPSRRHLPDTCADCAIELVRRGNTV